MASPRLQTTSGSINYQTTTNWNTLVAPTTGDSATIENSYADFTQGFYNTATLASLSIPMTFTGTLGLTAQSTLSVSGITRSSSTATATSAAHGYANGDAVTVSGAVQSDYDVTATISNVTTNTFDYTVANTPTSPATGTILVKRVESLIQPSTLVSVGLAGNTSGTTATGSGRIKLDLGSVTSTVTVYQTASGSNTTDANFEPVRIIGTNVSNTLYMVDGLVGLARTHADEVATFATVYQSNGELHAGSGLTWTTINQSGGIIEINSGSSSGTFNQSVGTYVDDDDVTQTTTATLNGAGTLSNLIVTGTVYLNLRKATAGDTITGVLCINDGGVVDLSQNSASISFTTLRVVGTGKIVRNLANPTGVSWTTLIGANPF